MSNVKVEEVSPDIYRISIFEKAFDLQFNHFLVKDDEPLLFHTGLNVMFDQVLEGVKSVINPSDLRWISFSHFESDECGALNEWLRIAPKSQAACSFVGATVNINDFAIRPARPITRDDVINTGKYSFRYYHTPHLPHGWDAGVLFEEKNKVLLCSDLFHQIGDVKTVSDDMSEILDRTRSTFREYNDSPFANYMPFTNMTEPMLTELADLNPKTLAIMHGSTFTGDGSKALTELVTIMRDELGMNK